MAVARADGGPFFRVADGFSIGGGGKWAGAVAASPAAVYLLKKRVESPYHGGGLAGALFAQADGAWDDVRSCRLVELPDLQRRHLDPLAIDGDCDIIIFPRAAVSLARFRTFALDLRCGPHSVGVFVGLIRVREVRESFERAGWVLDREVQPTALPVHGDGYGRSTAEPRPKRLGKAARTAYAAAAALLTVTVAAAEVYLRPAEESPAQRRIRLLQEREPRTVPPITPTSQPQVQSPVYN